MKAKSLTKYSIIALIMFAAIIITLPARAATAVHTELTDDTGLAEDTTESTGIAYPGGSKDYCEYPMPVYGPRIHHIYTIGANNYKVTKLASNKSDGIVKYITASNRSSIIIPGRIHLMDGYYYRVTVIGGHAFKYAKLKKVTIGQHVEKINRNAFSYSNVKTVTIKSKKLTKDTVHNCLKGSKVKLIRVSIGTAKENKAYVKKYKKIFTKSNVGKKVTVR